MSKLVRLGTFLAVAAGLLPTSASAGIMQRVTVTVENLAPTNSVGFAALRLGVHNGTFDAFNNGQTATAPIISVAELGSGVDWFPAFSAAEPNATLGSVGGTLRPGATASGTFMVDTSINQFFTFASMVVPSNDHFIGNDRPTQYRLFDDSGTLILTSILQQARQIWDAGSETFDPLQAAFLVGGNNRLRTEQNGVVSFDFTELSGFNGLTTTAGYVFDSQLTGTTDIYRISFTATAVPEPASVTLAVFGVIGTVAIRSLRRKK